MFQRIWGSLLYQYDLVGSFAFVSIYPHPDFEPSRRMTMCGVKASKWYNGEIYCKKEVVEYMKSHFGF